mmetsp:Transcript_55370/g.147735  ORF Transcript_55370/g.147735 Transcript_55370/m.147735 type:complete len:281 (-) Transcript_55370:112-954(-)
MTSRALFGNPDSEIDHEFGERLMKKDPKTAVNQFCQRFCNRPINKEDVIYTVTKYPQGYQATVKLNCIEGQEFAGAVANSQKEAEALASQQILDFYAEQINNMPKLTGKKKKSSGSGLGDPAAKVARIGEPAVVGALSPKSELNSTCSKIMRCVMEKGHVVYEAYQVEGGFQATVTMPKLPGEWGQQVWAGEVNSKKQEAEQSAAAIALEALRSDPSLMAAHNAPQKPKNWTPGQGKGKSKGPGCITKGGKGLQVGAQAANQWNAAAMGMGGMGGMGALW